MNEKYGVSRRRFLVASGGGTLAALAGCVEPRAESTVVESETTIDRENRADGSTYTDVYESTVDSVTLVRAFGVGEPVGMEDGDESEDGGQRQGQGSGFLYDQSHVVTNEHVVRGAEEVDLQYTTGEWTSATVAGTDIYSDLAVLRIDQRPDTATPLQFTEQHPRVGQEVLAIGNPLGLEGSMSTGVVSGVNRSTPGPTDFTIPNVVQTDATADRGSSGGPIVNLEGNVVGVVNAGAGTGGSITFGISAPLSRRVVPALIEDGEYRHSWMGINLLSVDPIVANANDIPEERGVLVVETASDGPADDILRGSDDTVDHRGGSIPVGGDVIRAMNGRPIPNEHELSAFLALETTPGETIEIEIYRDGEPTTVDLTLGEREEPNI